jgi:hypothetical protein
MATSPAMTPLALETVVNQTPSDTTNASSKVGAHSRHNSAEVSRQSRPSVEAEPSHPEEYGADDDMRNVVRTVVELLGTMSAPLSKHIRVCKRSSSRGNMHGGSASKVQTTHLVDPARGVPGPARDGVVDDGCPDEHVNDTGEHASSFGDGTNGECDTI